MCEKTNNASNRIIYLDILRVLASFSVVMTHVAQQIWYNAPIDTYEWSMANFYESIVRWSVPVFVMISGSLFLASNQKFKYIIHNNIVRLIRLLVVWGGIYFVESMLFGKGLNSSIYSVIYGPLWFLFMLICLYFTIPFLKKFISDDKLTIYFLALNIIATFIVPTISRYMNNISISAKRAIDIVIEDCNFYFASGYTGYFVLGYWLNKITINRKHKKLIYIFGILSFILLPIMTSVTSKKMGEIHDYYRNLSFGILFECIFLFCIAKEKFKCFDNRITKGFIYVSKHSLGVYLIHKIVIDVFNNMLRMKWDFTNIFFSLPLLSVCIFGISALASIILSKIPLLRKVLL